MIETKVFMEREKWIRQSSADGKKSGKLGKLIFIRLMKADTHRQPTR